MLHIILYNITFESYCIPLHIEIILLHILLYNIHSNHIVYPCILKLYCYIYILYNIHSNHIVYPYILKLYCYIYYYIIYIRIIYHFCIYPYINNKTSYNPSTIKSSHACCADFATPNEISNLAITVPIVPGTNDLASAFFTIGMVNVLSLLIFSVVIAAHIVWYFERNENEEQFPKFYLDGIDDAIWWSVTTVTTVGYGDKFPISSAGRIFGLVWMCFGLVIYAMFAVSILCCIFAHPKSEKNPISNS